MKKFRAITTWLLLFALIATTASAAEFSQAELKRMGIFLSNFTEVGLFTFEADDLSTSDLVHFGVWHNYINNFKSRIKRCTSDNGKPCQHGNLTIAGKFMSESVKKYFAKDIKPQTATSPEEIYYDSKTGLYHFGGADGDRVLYAEVKGAVSLDGIITMRGELYDLEDKTDRPATFIATAKPYKWAGKNTWSILTMDTEWRLEE